MSLFRHREIFQSDVSRLVRERRKRRPRPHRLDEFPAGYSSAGCSPAEPASASPAVDHSALQSSCQSIAFHRTANSVLTVCLSPGARRIKLLQKSYAGKVKLIYIDPPYNTGKDFVYPDNFQDNIKNYLELTGQTDSNGRKLSSNTEASGRFHTDWLNMIYPRLKLAKNLLTEDGVIFVSIDDNEVANIRLVFDEIFGSENFVATVIWQKVYAPKSSAKHFSEDHDYVLVYARNAETWRPVLLARTDAQNSIYKKHGQRPSW